MKKSINPMKDKGMDPKRSPRASGPRSGGGKKAALSATAPKYVVDGGAGDTVPRTKRAAGPKSGKKASRFALGSNAAGGYGVRGVGGPGAGNFGTRGVKS